MGFPGEERPLPMYSLFFFFWIKLLHTQIRSDNLNGEHQGGRYARQEKKLLMKIASAEERESCLEYVVHQRWDLKMKYIFKRNLK